jgi:3-oxoacyl-[acyl-carrier-protein] synthase-3
VRSVVVGIGSAVPETKLTNADLEAMVDTSDAWIVARTGIRERGKLTEEQATSDLATRAAVAALASAQLQPEDIDLIVVCTCTPDMPMPSTAALVQRNLKSRRNVPAYDLNAACAGFMFGLEVVVDQLRAGRYRRALLIGADAMTRLMDYEDRVTCVLFGDGAGALVLEARPEEATQGRGVIATIVRSDGEYWDLIHVPGGGSRRPASPNMLAQREQYMRMNGRQTFKLAVQAMAQVSKDVLEQSAWTLDSVDHVVVHQANLRIIDAVAERLGVDRAKLPLNVAHTGNTSAASIPVLLDECVRAGRIVPGDRILCAGFGSGLSWGAAALVW